MQLCEATEAQKIERDHVTFPEWGKRLTLAQYLEREQALRAHPFSRGMRTWLLVEGTQVLASCETYDNVSRVGSASGTSWSIASVYVEERFRGRGYATRMMNLLGEEADRRGIQACTLYSDVGEAIYARSGYVLSPPLHDWLLAARAGPSTPCEPIVPVLSVPPPRVLQLEPTREQLDWAFERERLYTRFLGRTPPRTHAARNGGAHAAWAAYFKSNELIVLWLEPGTPEETNAVLDAARAEAHHCGLERVRLWALPHVARPQDASDEKRKEELPMFRPSRTGNVDSWARVQRALWV